MASRGVGPIAELFDAGTLLGLDDAGLIGRFLADPDGAAGGRAFAALVARHGPMVRAVCRGVLRDDHDAEDAAQATFLILARRAGSIRRSDSAASWLFGVARRVSLRARADAARRRAREARAAVPELADPAPGRDPDDLAALIEEIDRLPAHARAAVVLCDLEGLTYEAAARHLDWPTGTLATRLRRARERLRARLARRGVAAVDASPLALLGGSPTLGRATAAGAVSRSVATLSGRTMTMMRLKALGWGLVTLTVGTAGLGVAALAAMQDPAPLPTAPTTSPRPPQPAPKPAETRKWTRPLPGGATVELIGIATLDDGPAPGLIPVGMPATRMTGRASWRTLDGGLMQIPPGEVFSNIKMSLDEGQRGCALAIRISSPSAQQIAWKCPSTLGLGGAKFGTIVRTDGVEGIVGVCLPRDRQSISVRFGVASQAWATVYTSKNGGNIHRSEPGFDIIFGEAQRAAGGTTLAVGHNFLDHDVRVVAVDRQGKERLPTMTGGSVGLADILPGAKFHLTEVRFDREYGDIEEFRLQVRPYEWVTFEDIPLRPDDPALDAK